MVCARHGEAVQVDPIKPTLKPTGTKRLKLKCDILLSNYALKVNLRRYTMAEKARLQMMGGDWDAALETAQRIQGSDSQNIEALRLIIFYLLSCEAGAYTRQLFGST